MVKESQDPEISLPDPQTVDAPAVSNNDADVEPEDIIYAIEDKIQIDNFD